MFPMGGLGFSFCLRGFGEACGGDDDDADSEAVEYMERAVEGAELNISSTSAHDTEEGGGQSISVMIMKNRQTRMIASQYPESPPTFNSHTSA